MLVLKFGGTSVAQASRIQTICELVKKNQGRQAQVVVVSALFGITDRLLSIVTEPAYKTEAILKQIQDIHFDLAEKLFSNLELKEKVLSYLEEKFLELLETVKLRRNNPGFMDKVASFGEILSSYIISQALNQSGIGSRQVLASEIIVTNSHFGSAEFMPNLTEKRVREKIKPLLSKGIIPVVTGFIGATIDNKVTTLGRGGSDYTASIIAYCLQAKEVQIWTDVDGVYTADPKVVEDAKLIDVISYKEASEMATFGAKVLHPRTIRPAIYKNISVRVLNTFKPDLPGTLITQEVSEEKGLKAVAFKRKTTLINIYSTEMLFSKGYLAKIFDIFAKEDISIDLVSVSEVSVSVTLDDHPRIANVISELKKFSSVTHTSQVGIVSLVGEDIISSSHVLTEISSLFHEFKIPIKMISFGASNINISFVLDSEDVEKAVRLVHERILINRGKRQESRVNGDEQFSRLIPLATGD